MMKNYLKYWTKEELKGSGAYGKVYKAKTEKFNHSIAIKTIKNGCDENGFNSNILREVLLLKELDHENIIKLLDIVYNTGNNKVYLVFEYFEKDLHSLISNCYKHNLPLNLIKVIMKQLLKAVECIHSKFIIHRDLKPQNILVKQPPEIEKTYSSNLVMTEEVEQGKIEENFEEICIKVADFGLARKYSVPFRPFSKEVITQWYRPPELLIGEHIYDTKVDMWSVGCILGELLTGYPLFPGRNEIDQLDKIFQLLGTPGNEYFCDKKVIINRIHGKKELRIVFPKIPASGLDLLEGLLQIDPVQRLSAKDALKHEFFQDDSYKIEP